MCTSDSWLLLIPLLSGMPNITFTPRVPLLLVNTTSIPLPELTPDRLDDAWWGVSKFTKKVDALKKLHCSVLYDGGKEEKLISQ